MQNQALDNLTVLDLTHFISGPLCSRLLADLGAEVIKIEGPFKDDVSDPECSLPFLYYNFNKKGVTLNLKSEAGIKILKALISKVDILVENFEPRVLAGLGLDYETLEKINPKLIVTSISNFGQTGPYRDYQATDLVEYALGGML